MICKPEVLLIRTAGNSKQDLRSSDLRSENPREAFVPDSVRGLLALVQVRDKAGLGFRRLWRKIGFCRVAKTQKN